MDINTAASTARTSRPTRDDRPDITLADGRVFKPRFRVAANAGVNERTLKRKNAPTIYVGNCAYVEENFALLALVGNPQRRNQPSKKRSR